MPVLKTRIRQLTIFSKAVPFSKRVSRTTRIIFHPLVSVKDSCYTCHMSSINQIPTFIFSLLYGLKILKACAHVMHAFEHVHITIHGFFTDNLNQAESESARPIDKSAYLFFFLIFQPKHMLFVLKRTISMRRFY